MPLGSSLGQCIVRCGPAVPLSRQRWNLLFQQKENHHAKDHVCRKRYPPGTAYPMTPYYGRGRTACVLPTPRAVGQRRASYVAKSTHITTVAKWSRGCSILETSKNWCKHDTHITWVIIFSNTWHRQLRS